jgi:hypothetical protein
MLSSRKYHKKRNQYTIIIYDDEVANNVYLRNGISLYFKHEGKNYNL